MAITFGAVSAVADGTTSVSVAYPAGIAAGQNLTLVLAYKSPPVVHDTVAGFTLEATVTEGLGSDTVSDQGGVTLAVLTRTATGSESGTVTVNVPSGSVTQGFMISHTPGVGSTFDIASAVGGEDTPSTAWSVVLGSDPGMTVDDLVLAIYAANTNSVTAFSTQVISAAGVTTWGAAVERIEQSTGTGRDQAVGMSEHAVVSGTSSGAPTFTMAVPPTSNATSPTGPVILLRLREITAPLPPQIVAHPEARTVVEPNTANFTASITGADTLQWKRKAGGVGAAANVVGGTGATTLSYVTGATSVTGGNHNDTDTYALEATNAQGTVTTNYAPLSVNPLGSDSEAPSAPGTPAPSGLTKSAVTMTHTAATDNTGVTGYEYQIGAEAVVDTGSAALAVPVTGRTPGSTISYRVRAYDAAGNRGAFSAAVNVTFPIYGFSFNSLLGYQAGSFVGSLVGLGLDVGVGVVVRANDNATGAVVATSGTMTTDANGRLSRWTHASLDLGVTYELVSRRTSDGARDIKVAVAT